MREVVEPFFSAAPESDDAGPISNPKDVGIALRDSRIQSVLHTLASGEQILKQAEPAPSPPPPEQVRPTPSQETPTWFWPLVVALAATCTMLVVLVVLTFVP